MKEKLGKKYRPSVLSREPYKRRSESEMIRIVKEVNSGIIGKRAACSKYGVNRNTLALFIRRFSVRTLGNELSTQLLANMTENQKMNLLERKVKELTKILDDAKLKNASLETMIQVAEDDLHIKIRKKRGTKQSRECGKVILTKA
jgi:transposase-like protein